MESLYPIIGIIALLGIFVWFQVSLSQFESTRWFDRGDQCIMSDDGQHVISLKPGSIGDEYVYSHYDYGARYRPLNPRKDSRPTDFFDSRRNQRHVQEVLNQEPTKLA